jgi:branched-subunit amino acid ABC-type transport system permease component
MPDLTLLAIAAVAGLILGTVRAQVAWHSSGRWEDAATFVILAMFLLLIPGGLSSLAGARTRIEDTR